MRRLAARWFAAETLRRTSAADYQRRQWYERKENGEQTTERTRGEERQIADKRWDGPECSDSARSETSEADGEMMRAKGATWIGMWTCC